MMPQHHPAEELLLDYAFGSMREPKALAIATHLVFCPDCRDGVTRLERTAGDLLDQVGQSEPSANALDTLLQHLDDPVDRDTDNGGTPRAEALQGVPSPLRPYLDAPLENLAWNQRGRAFFEYRVPIGMPGYDVKILKIPAGHGTPTHTHLGTELTQVLLGGFHDTTGHYRAGDLAQADHSLVHRPVADDDGDCICLAVTDGDLRLAGPISKWLNPFFRY